MSDHQLFSQRDAQVVESAVVNAAGRMGVDRCGVGGGLSLDSMEGLDLPSPVACAGCDDGDVEYSDRIWRAAASGVAEEGECQGDSVGQSDHS